MTVSAPISQPPLETALPLRFRQVRLGFHTSPDIPGIAADFDPKEFTEVLANVQVNAITCFAHYHHGQLYYHSMRFPERIHPHLAWPDRLKE